jgi:murein DD-endopeptidase MepM/ murein hydrolase activator NlpD
MRSILAALLCAAALPGAALAQTPAPTGGTPPPAPPPAPPPPAPTATPPATTTPAASTQRPAIDAITCRTACQGIARATIGSTVRVSGDGMGSATSIVLLGGKGSRDDVTVPATPVSPTAVEATLPRGAHTGAVRAIGATGQRSAVSRARLIIRPSGSRDPGGPLVEAKAETKRLVFEGGRKATVDFYVRGSAPADVAVDVVRASDQVAVAHFAIPGAAPGKVQSVDWDGTIAGVEQPDGRYVFQVAAAIGGGAARAAQAAPAPRRESFWIVHAVFPIAGPHTYGDGFGVQRSGHTHQGQDVMASCGTPLVAVDPGKVKFVGRQSLAGNYIVISDEDGTGDYVYMHLRDKALVSKGDTVTTGETIGYVGKTGDATACHLHFELWPAPGWYTGGQAVDPLPSLKAWDAGAV